jgi:hypothetical protein
MEKTMLKRVFCLFALSSLAATGSFADETEEQESTEKVVEQTPTACKCKKKKDEETKFAQADVKVEEEVEEAATKLLAHHGNEDEHAEEACCEEDDKATKLVVDDEETTEVLEDNKPALV